MSFLVVFGTVLIAVICLVAAAILSPVVLVVDTAVGEMRVRWLVALEYRRPLPGTKGEKRLHFAGIPVRLPARRAEAPETGAPAAGEPLGPARRARDKRRRKHRRLNRFFWRCVRDAAIRPVLGRQAIRFGRALVRSAAVTAWRASVSLDDPAANGMLAGGLAAWSRGQQPLQVNFQGENNLYLEIRLYPHRLTKAALAFLSGMPYRAMLREWCACSEQAA